MNRQFNDAEFDAYWALQRDGIFGGDECPEWSQTHPRISEATGAIQLLPDGRWFGGEEPELPDPENCGFCGEKLTLGEYYTCTNCLILEEPEQ